MIFQIEEQEIKNYTWTVLKTVNPHFDNVMCGRKTFEIRSTKDREFVVGQNLLLREFTPDGFTNRAVWVVISHILTHDDFPDGIKPDYAILSFVHIHNVAIL